ncbi:GDP-mannose 4,6-dehydratase [uncultured archaeon]|nr:GDP-mannose 4,6-dehydratase [uncultured archaeon]
MKTTIITGITGGDGAYLAKLLLEKGYKVIGITRSYNSCNIHKLKYLGRMIELLLKNARCNRYYYD